MSTASQYTRDATTADWYDQVMLSCDNLATNFSECHFQSLVNGSDVHLSMTLKTRSEAYDHALSIALMPFQERSAVPVSRQEDVLRWLRRTLYTGSRAAQTAADIVRRWESEPARR